MIASVYDRVVGDSPKKNHSPFAALAALKDSLPEGTPREEVAPLEAKGDPFAGKIVVARSRKGRGGKTVTEVRGIAGSDELLETMARELRHALGCGALVEEGVIVVSGDQSARVQAWLRERGAKRVVSGS